MPRGRALLLMALLLPPTLTLTGPVSFGGWRLDPPALAWLGLCALSLLAFAIVRTASRGRHRSPGHGNA